MKGPWIVVVATSLLALAGCAGDRHEMGHGSAAGERRPVLYDSLGSYSYRITTGSPEARRWPSLSSILTSAGVTQPFGPL